MSTFEKPSDDELRQHLTSEQYKVTQHEGTEPPFQNAYWDNKQPGIYVDIVSGEVLFSSLDKYETGTGWPSFTKPLASKILLHIPIINSSWPALKSARRTPIRIWDMSLMMGPLQQENVTA